jgi:hypothetical protein
METEAAMSQCAPRPNSRPGSIHRLESLFKEDPLLEEDEKACVADEETEAEGEEEDVFVPPDGGYGWFVTLGAFISLFWTSGLVGAAHCQSGYSPAVAAKSASAPFWRIHYTLWMQEMSRWLNI